MTLHLLILRTLRIIPLLAKFLIPQELGIHSSCGHILGTLLLLDTIGMCLVRVVVCAGVLLLLFFRDK